MRRLLVFIEFVLRNVLFVVRPVAVQIAGAGAQAESIASIAFSGMPPVIAAPVRETL